MYLFHAVCFPASSSPSWATLFPEISPIWPFWVKGEQYNFSAHCGSPLLQLFPCLLLSCSPLSHCLSPGEPVYLGRRALQWELILAKCGLYQLSGKQGLQYLGCIVSLLLLVGQTVYSSPCSFIPHWGIIHDPQWWQEQHDQEGGGAFRGNRLLQCFLTTP